MSQRRFRRRGTRRRVVVTGAGAVTALGQDLKTTLARWRAGEVALTTTTTLDGRPRLAGRVPGFEPRDAFRQPKAIKVADRKTQLAVAATSMALRAAAFPEHAEARAGLAVILGCAFGDLEAERLGDAVAPDPGARSATDAAFFSERVLRRLTPLWLLVNLPNMLSAQVAIQLDATGPNYTVITEGIAGLQAIAEGFELVRSGEVPAAIVGAAECPLTPFCFACLAGQGCSAEELVLGEAAAVLLLESWEHARDRAASPLAEITGAAVRSAPPVGTSKAAPFDARRDWTAAIISAMQGALAPSRQPPSRRERGAPRVLAAEPPHAGASAAELEALARLGFERAPGSGAELRRCLGHTLGAAGALQATFAIASASPVRGQSHGILCNSLGHTGLAASLAVEIRGWEAT
jgi:3-oxoacyl-[acyl-carrier-protein] synthase II